MYGELKCKFKGDDMQFGKNYEETITIASCNDREKIKKIIEKKKEESVLVKHKIYTCSCVRSIVTIAKFAEAIASGIFLCKVLSDENYHTSFTSSCYNWWYSVLALLIADILVLDLFTNSMTICCLQGSLANEFEAHIAAKFIGYEQYGTTIIKYLVNYGISLWVTCEYWLIQYNVEDPSTCASDGMFTFIKFTMVTSFGTPIAGAITGLVFLILYCTECYEKNVKSLKEKSKELEEKYNEAKIELENLKNESQTQVVVIEKSEHNGEELEVAEAIEVQH